jgi:hypothetical protein
MYPWWSNGLCSFRYHLPFAAAAAAAVVVVVAVVTAAAVVFVVWRQQK